MKVKYPKIKVRFLVEKHAFPFNQMSEADSLFFLSTVETALIQNNVTLDECNKFILQAGNDIKNLIAISMTWVTIDFV